MGAPMLAADGGMGSLYQHLWAYVLVSAVPVMTRTGKRLRSRTPQRGPRCSAYTRALARRASRKTPAHASCISHPTECVCLRSSQRFSTERTWTLVAERNHERRYSDSDRLRTDSVTARALRAASPRRAASSATTDSVTSMRAAREV